MLILGIILAVLTVALAAAAVGAARIVRNPGPPVMWQFGKFTNVRPGIKNHEFWADEPDFVPFIDFHWWIRLRPNPGVNLPVFGYWSQAKGYRRRR